MPDTPLREHRADGTRLTPLSRYDKATARRNAIVGVVPVLLPVAVAVTIGAIFISVYLAAFHAPVPHGMKIAVVGTPAEVAAVEKQLADPSPDSFRVEQLPDKMAARSAVEHGDVFAAYLPIREHSMLFYAGAHGPSVTSLIIQSFGEVAKADGQRLEPVDVVPASAHDTRGLAVFYTTFGLVLAGYLFGIMTYQLAPGIALARRLAGLATFGAVGGLTVASIVSAYGAMPAPFLGVAGLVALVALAVGASTMVLVRGLGVAGSSLAAVVFMTIGNATSGGSLPANFLPSWLRPFASALPVGAGVRAVNGLAYFHGDGVLSGIAILTAWALAGIGGLLLLEHGKGRNREITSRLGAPYASNA
ncbi:ABC transporter permease [Streptomyces sp. NPDC052207]|uniref:ABC transporter permease n=1 Tax=Streptomyces sp. NPDC052207 TaxID=3155418 RepID=UPI0034487FE6